MIKRLTIKNWRFTLTIARVARVIGVNSNVFEDGHILMWDFDDVEFAKVKYALETVQTIYDLSDIHILRTKEPDNYIAYCFTKVSWKRTVEIVCRTSGIDWQFFRFGVYRGHFTLRVTAKNGRVPYLVERLKSSVKPNVEPFELQSWVRYETLNWR